MHAVNPAAVENENGPLFVWRKAMASKTKYETKTVKYLFSFCSFFAAVRLSVALSVCASVLHSLIYQQSCRADALVKFSFFFLLFIFKNKNVSLCRSIYVPPTYFLFLSFLFSLFSLRCHAFYYNMDMDIALTHTHTPNGNNLHQKWHSLMHPTTPTSIRNKIAFIVNRKFSAAAAALGFLIIVGRFCCARS